MQCVNCETNREVSFKDPQIPPLETGECLCQGCYVTRALDRMEDLQEEMDGLIGILAELAIP